jgi:hypothetical protein
VVESVCLSGIAVLLNCNRDLEACLTEPETQASPTCEEFHRHGASAVFCNSGPAHRAAGHENALLTFRRPGDAHRTTVVHEIHMETESLPIWDKILDRVVSWLTVPPLGQLQPLKDPLYVRVYRERFPAKRIGEDASSRLRSDPWQTNEKRHRILIVHIPEKVEGEIISARRTDSTLEVRHLHGRQESYEFSRSLLLESSGPED